MAIESRYSIVVDSTPRICRQAVAWTRCALTLAGIAPDRLQVNVMSSVPAAFTTGMARWGVKCRRLPEGVTAGPLNKIRQLEPGVIPPAPLTVLCDCDTVFTMALPEFDSSSGLFGKLVDIGNPPFHYWRRLFLVSGLRMTDNAVRVARNGRHTYRNNLNGGLYVIREDVREDLFRVWRAFIGTLLANPEYVRPWWYHTDQIAFALACARLELSVDLVDERINYPLHLRPSVGQMSDPPVMLHHHQGLAAGILRYGAHADTVAHGPVQQAVNQVNSVLRRVAWSRFGL